MGTNSPIKNIQIPFWFQREEVCLGGGLKGGLGWGVVRLVTVMKTDDEAALL